MPPTLDRLQLVMDDAVTRMPHLPEQHLTAATRTPQRITSRTGPHAITIGLRRHDAIRPLDQPTQDSPPPMKIVPLFSGKYPGEFLAALGSHSSFRLMA